MTLQMMPDGSFEGATPTAGWVKVTGNWSTITGSASHGTKHLRFTTVNTSLTSMSGPKCATAAGQTVSVGVTVKQAALGGTWELRVAFYDRDGTFLSQSSATALPLTGSWVRKTATAVAPDDAALYAIRILRNGAGSTLGDAIDVDAVVCAPGTYSGGWVAPPGPRDNIILINMDDTSLNVIPHMQEITNLKLSAIDFVRFMISTPVCGPSRATTLTSLMPHTTGVLTNEWPDGGFDTYYVNGLENKSIGALLKAAGYRTSLMGKFQNHYSPSGNSNPAEGEIYPALYVPLGWDWWWVPSNGYQEFSYNGVESFDGDVASFSAGGENEDNYITDVLSEYAIDFVNDHVANHAAEPFFLYLNPFATHGGLGEDPEDDGIAGPTEASRFPPAPRDRKDHPNRPASWGEPEYPVTGDLGPIPVPWPDYYREDEATNWNTFATPKLEFDMDVPLTSDRLDEFHEYHLDRIRQAQAVNDMLEDLFDRLVFHGILDDTYIIFTSDNGFHLGEHSLSLGKGFGYMHDVNLPCVIRPPGGSSFRTNDKLVSNIDFLPTFLDIAGYPAQDWMDGQSLLPYIAGNTSNVLRNTHIVEYYADLTWDQAAGTGDAPKHVTLIDSKYTYIDYARTGVPPSTAKGQFFNNVADPGQIDNRYAEVKESDAAANNEFLHDYWGSTGHDFWAAGMGTLLGPAGGSGTVGTGFFIINEDVEYPLNGLISAIETRAFGWGLPQRIGTDAFIPFSPGTSHNPNKVFGPKRFALPMWVLGAEADGSEPQDGEALRRVRDRVEELTRLMSPYNGLFRLVYREASGGRQIYLEALDGFDARNAVNAARFTPVVNAPFAFWENTEVTTQTVSFGPDLTSKIMWFSATTGASAPCPDAKVRLIGQFANPRVVDRPSGAGFTYHQNVNAGQVFEYDAATRMATKDGVDVRRHVSHEGGKFVLHPRGDSSGTYGLRVFHDGDTGNPDVQLECRVRYHSA